MSVYCAYGYEIRWDGIERLHFSFFGKEKVVGCVTLRMLLDVIVDRQPGSLLLHQIEDYPYHRYRYTP